jgi:hypothetical protein
VHRRFDELPHRVADLRRGFGHLFYVSPEVNVDAAEELSYGIADAPKQIGKELRYAINCTSGAKQSVILELLACVLGGDESEDDRNYGNDDHGGMLYGSDGVK